MFCQNLVVIIMVHFTDIYVATISMKFLHHCCKMCACSMQLNFWNVSTNIHIGCINVMYGIIRYLCT